ncbi:PREDICTED: uncharacterized protein LOC100635783 [Amphimedon queenslandica]|uniref:Uncharacterized protein n=1 Tax=Amphimedon queenslandica TaxID=400682 RepID=A0A1X7UEE3_AMPQE|nr:PREDICTED: uncharacterized protein LOC100635783 [Amphimedon queenslandica]|eukprot:XP_003388274.2 PREDICTED: uncharacterized protein LOC100635783 [Amphimedon queenslandica]
MLGVDFLIHKTHLLTQDHNHRPKQQEKVQKEGKREREYIDKCIDRLLGNESRDKNIHGININSKTRPISYHEAIPQDYALSRIERLKTECSLYHMDQKLNELDDSLTSIASHNSWASSARVTRQNVELACFVRRKRHLLTNPATCRRVEHRLCNQTGPVLIAKIIRDGPKPSSSPATIWAELVLKEGKMKQERIQS